MNINKKRNSIKKSCFTMMVEAKLIDDGFITKETLFHLASISFTEAELMRKDANSKRRKKSLKPSIGLRTFIGNFLSHLKTRPPTWFKKANGFVEGGRLVIKP